jgi:ferredoxin
VVLLYRSQGKVMNCGGGGSCGTCIVEVFPLHPNLQHRMSAVQLKIGEWTHSQQYFF